VKVSKPCRPSPLTMRTTAMPWPRGTTRAARCSRSAALPCGFR
jgi:hypothetical protein